MHSTSSPHETGEPGKAGVECRGVSKQFGGVAAIDDVSVRFVAGRVTALIGPNGAGKTTLFHVMSGALAADRGEVYLEGSRIDGRPPWRVCRAGLGRLLQDVRLFGHMTVLENVLAGFKRPLGENPLASMFWRGGVLREQEKHIERARYWLERVGIADLEASMGADLSYGQQKLAAMARMLVAEPKVLLLDEPAAGLNPTVTATLVTLLRELAAEGRCVVAVEHDLGFVLEASDWTECMNNGKILVNGSPATVLNDEAVRQAYLGV